MYHLMIPVTYKFKPSKSGIKLSNVCTSIPPVYTDPQCSSGSVWLPTII